MRGRKRVRLSDVLGRDWNVWGEQRGCDQRHSSHECSFHSKAVKTETLAFPNRQGTGVIGTSASWTESHGCFRNISCPWLHSILPQEVCQSPLRAPHDQQVTVVSFHRGLVWFCYLTSNSKTWLVSMRRQPYCICVIWNHLRQGTRITYSDELLAHQFTACL